MICVKAIPEKEARYDTIGDWLIDANGNLQVLLPGGDDPFADDRTFLVALHEMVEAKLCHKRNISQTAVDLFDFSFSGGGEPGDDPACPYRHEHRQACLIEFIMADFLGVAGYGRME